MKETCNNGIKKRILMGFILFFITIGFIFIMIVKNIFIKSFENLEKDEVEHNIEMVKSEINNELDELTTMATIWDDKYLFAQELDENSVKIILKDNTFDLLNIDMIILSDESGEVLHGKQIDFETWNLKEMDKVVSENIIQLGFLENIEIASPFKGIVIIDSIPILIVSHPFYTDDSSASTKGSLMFGRMLNADMMSEISKKFSFSVSYELIHKLEYEKSGISDGQDIEIQVRNKDNIVGTFYLDDVINI